MMGYLRGGWILRVDLSEGKIRRDPVEPFAERFTGGKAINLKILFDGVGQATKPLDPDNLLIFGAGPRGPAPKIGRFGHGRLPEFRVEIRRV
jgi:aldehyde:ferredoxin oxidoreductase